MEMTSSRPYLVRAIYQWIADIQNGKIILNIAPMAVSNLVLGDDDVSFSARFSGKPQAIYIPVDAVLAIYAKENGQGMMFSDDDGAISADDDGDDPDPDKPKRPSLRVVK